jgi:hypothetical protein
MMPREESAAANLALMLETACEQFEVLQQMIAGQLTVTSQDPRAVHCIQMALAKGFIFSCIRARRICEHGKKAGLTIPDQERRIFVTKINNPAACGRVVYF